MPSFALHIVEQSLVTKPHLAERKTGKSSLYTAIGSGKNWVLLQDNKDKMHFGEGSHL